MRRNDFMNKLKIVVASVMLVVSTQTVHAACETARAIGEKGGGATGAFVGGTLGATAAAGGLSAACAAALAVAPFTFGISVLGCVGVLGATARIGGAAVGEIVGSIDGQHIANVICDSRRDISFKIAELVIVGDFKGVIIDFNHKRKRVRLIVSASEHLVPVELDISRIAKLK